MIFEAKLDSQFLLPYTGFIHGLEEGDFYGR
jgi:hypothetical protein